MFFSIPFPPIFSSPTTTSTPLTGIRLNPCATPLWRGPSGHLADPTPNTCYEPKFCNDVSSEHTPTNLPTRNMGFQQVYDATIAASEDPILPPQSAASSSSQHSAASTVPTSLKLGSSGTSHRKLSADYDSVANRTSIKETCADMDRETVVSSLLGSVSKEERDRDQNVVQTLRDRQNLHKILERKVELAVRGDKLAQQIFTVSAPAQTSDPAIAATSAQLQVDGKRNDSSERGCEPAVETKRGTPKDSDTAACEMSGEEKRSEADQPILESVV